MGPLAHLSRDLAVPAPWSFSGRWPGMIHQPLGPQECTLCTSKGPSPTSCGLFVMLWTTARPASLSITNSQRLLKLMSTELVMPSHHLILCHHLLLPSILPSIRVFSKETVLPIRWPKYWRFSFSISASSEYSGLISFRMDWLDR